MLKFTIVRTVALCVRHPWWVIAAGVVVGVLSAGYAARHFAITADLNQLISPDLPWRNREVAFLKQFPQREILVVLDAPTPELAEQATARLVAALGERKDVIRAIRQPGGGSFFAHNGLLFLPPEEVSRIAKGLVDAEPLIETLAVDPSLRGELDALSFGVMGVQRGELKLDDLSRPLTMVSDTLDDLFAGRPASFSWRFLISTQRPRISESRRLIEVDPKLNLNALTPGRATTDIIQQTASELKLGPEYGARVRLTGRVPIEDDEYGTLKQGAALNATATILGVLIILWLALRSPRIIVAVALSLVVGLAATAALGLLMVGAFNLISVAFAVLFVGLGVDFGIQFSVRYRSERHDTDQIETALLRAAEKAGGPLALAAAATTIGFFSFLPTDYRGLSELGQIAGCGMLIAFLTSITLLPAMLKLFNPPGEPHSMGFGWLAPVDRFLERRRVPVIVTTLALVVLLLPLLYFVRFDFNPLNLRNPNVESVATFLDLRNDPEAGANSIEILAPSLEQANLLAERLSALPEVWKTRTLSSFVPDEQPQKLAKITAAAQSVDPMLNPKELDPPPSDAELVEALSGTADSLVRVAGSDQGTGTKPARRLAELLARLAKADPATRNKAEAVFVPPLRLTLDGLRQQLKPQQVTLETLPPELRRDWVNDQGQARLEVLPRGDPNDNDTLRSFATAVLAVAPSATGAAVSFLESGRTVVRAFIVAGAWALGVIAILLWITLRRIGDVLLTLVPLVVAGLVTMEICVIINLPFNFANIIALPLLLGVGVAFKIYYIMAWRSGKTQLLQSTLTRAVIYSAMTTATAFGSLWLSNHPGTSSMGKLMALSLVCTLAAAVLFQPVLMGPPRESAS